MSIYRNIITKNNKYINQNNETYPQHSKPQNIKISLQSLK